jgi:hypothetical protein
MQTRTSWRLSASLTWCDPRGGRGGASPVVRDDRAARASRARLQMKHDCCD